MDPVFVTGCPRSGTTWIGKMIALSKTIGYIHEPYNFLIKYNLPGDPNPYRFFVADNVDTGSIHEKYGDLLNFTYPFWENFLEHKSISNLINTGYHHFKFKRYRRKKLRPLIKDPFSIFSSEWLVNQFSVKPIILIRHPGPIFDSFKRLKWGVDLPNITNKSVTTDKSFEISTTDNNQESNKDIAEQVGLMWSKIYDSVTELKEEHPNWLFIRYEDIFTNIERNFEKIFSYLGLALSDAILAKIYHYTSKGYFPDDKKSNTSEIDRSDLLNGWKSRISDEEIDNLTTHLDQKVFNSYYKNSSWETDIEYY